MEQRESLRYNLLRSSDSVAEETRTPKPESEKINLVELGDFLPAIKKQTSEGLGRGTVNRGI